MCDPMNAAVPSAEYGQRSHGIGSPLIHPIRSINRNVRRFYLLAGLIAVDMAELAPDVVVDLCTVVARDGWKTGRWLPDNHLIRFTGRPADALASLSMR